MATPAVRDAQASYDRDPGPGWQSRAAVREDLRCMPADFEAPHPNGSVQPEQKPKRKHAPWEFLILSLFVAILCIGIILGWTLIGSKSPERLDEQTAAPLANACESAQTALKALPNPAPTLGADRVARIRAENDIFTTMIAAFHQVRPTSPTEADALRLWADDWQKVVAARAKYADELAATEGTDDKVRFISPAGRGVKPITTNMDDYVRQSHPYLQPCFTKALELELVEGQREYKEVTE
jgi:hypothetical protein